MKALSIDIAEARRLKVEGRIPSAEKRLHPVNNLRSVHGH
jgi:hypothetical protein